MPKSETTIHKKSKDFWSSLGRKLGFTIQQEEQILEGFIDITWRKSNLLIAIEIECGNISNLNLNKFKDLNPSFVIVECFCNSVAKKVEEERKNFNFNILILNHGLRDSYKYFQEVNKVQNDFIRENGLKEEFYKFIHPEE